MKAKVVDRFFAERDGPAHLAEIYRFVRSLPKASANRHPEAKVRQTLQRGPYRSTAPGMWERT